MPHYCVLIVFTYNFWIIRKGVKSIYFIFTGILNDINTLGYKIHYFSQKATGIPSLVVIPSIVYPYYIKCMFKYLYMENTQPIGERYHWKSFSKFIKINKNVFWKGLPEAHLFILLQVSYYTYKMGCSFLFQYYYYRPLTLSRTHTYTETLHTTKTKSKQTWKISIVFIQIHHAFTYY